MVDARHDVKHGPETDATISFSCLPFPFFLPLVGWRPSQLLVGSFLFFLFRHLIHPVARSLSSRALRCDPRSPKPRVASKWTDPTRRVTRLGAIRHESLDRLIVLGSSFRVLLLFCL